MACSHLQTFKKWIVTDIYIYVSHLATSILIYSLYSKKLIKQTHHEVRLGAVLELNNCATPSAEEDPVIRLKAPEKVLNVTVTVSKV